MRARTPKSCAVCGSPEVLRDEVLDTARLGLAECERCGHLWTERPLLRALRTLDVSEAEVAIAA